MFTNGLYVGDACSVIVGDTFFKGGHSKNGGSLVIETQLVPYCIYLWLGSVELTLTLALTLPKPGTVIQRCQFLDNKSTHSSGGLMTTYDTRVEGCTFRGNNGYNGAAISTTTDT